jgi:hypothetical protein
MALINEFNLEIKDIKGKENQVADALSRSVQMVHLVIERRCEYDIK